MQSQTPGIMELLKEETRELHDAAENHPFQRDFSRGLLPRELYVDFLTQMYLVHRGLEGRLRLLRESHPAWGVVVDERVLKEPFLRADLDRFGVKADSVQPSPAAARWIERMIHAHAASPAVLLGYLYVLEGSTNGSRFVAKNVARAYGLSPGPGLSYLDPYGDRQRERWQEFKGVMNSIAFSPQEVPDILVGAREMFLAIAGISGDLLVEKIHPPAPLTLDSSASDCLAARVGA